MTERTILETVQRWRRPRYSARPFALTILAVTLISLLAWAKGQAQHDTHRSIRTSLAKRDLIIQNEECRNVYHADDKCAFVLANCPDEEAGIISYLTLYYCKMPHLKPVAFTILTLWLGVLFSTIGIAASDFFCINLNTIASMLGMSESLAGVTLLAFGNGSPDVFSTFAAFRTHAASLAVGELIGAACFITAVVSGSMALIRPFQVARKSFIRDVSFFLVAAIFTMGFIVDGKLHLWESLLMVGFYLFYVAFVVGWHWWINQKKARKLKAAAMRSHFVMPGGEEEEVPEYHDDETPIETRTPGRSISNEDFSILERAGGANQLDEDDEEEERERWMGEMTNNMRLNRPPLGTRRNTHTPIRPSLVGALEFRAVLWSLQKSRNIQSMPISLRRYSDDPNYTSAQQQEYISTDSDPASRPPFDVASLKPDDASLHVTRPSIEIQQNMGYRTRAVSTNDIANVRVHPDTLQGTIPDITFGPATPDERNRWLTAAPLLPSPAMSLSPPSPRTSMAAPPVSRDRLAPPGADGQNASPTHSRTTSTSPLSSPVVQAGERPAPPTLKLTVPAGSNSPVTSPILPFPAYTEHLWPGQSNSRPPSLRPHSPSASPDSMFPRDAFPLQDATRTPRWWPASILPLPHILFGTLFPTLTNWSEKSFWEKGVGIIAGLPVFLLTITLPVVEPTKEDDEVGAHADLPLDYGLPTPRTRIGSSMDSHRRSIVLPPESLATPGTSMNMKVSTWEHGATGTSFSTTRSTTPQVFITSNDNIAQSPSSLGNMGEDFEREPKPWNRWLVIVQIFTAPVFIVGVMWANVQADEPRALVRHVLYSLVGSLCMLALILVTTTPNRPPRWRSGLCFIGFAVAIAWISTIANEVVGVLRTLGVVLNMSDAILGLTIFAVGNSLGDLVADITVARLGFPVMALSACFGGPMLNILLGVGLSGCYMTITRGERKHEKHPGKPVHFAPYHIVVSTTLVISGATLLATLCGLLVAVPLRKWKMDKVIGCGLVAVWVVSTFANVLVEVLGFGSMYVVG